MAIEDESVDEIRGGTGAAVSRGGSVILDHNHPLYLSSSDVQGALSVGIQLLGIENYTL